jgi:RPA family protein
VNRADFHAHNLDTAREEARRLFAAKAELQGAWLNWLAAQIYTLRPAEYASMVRRELQSLQEKSDS